MEFGALIFLFTLITYYIMFAEPQILSGVSTAGQGLSAAGTLLFSLAFAYDGYQEASRS